MRDTWKNFVPVPWLRSLTNISKKHSKRLAQNFFGITISFDHMRVNFDKPGALSFSRTLRKEPALGEAEGVGDGDHQRTL